MGFLQDGYEFCFTSFESLDSILRTQTQNIFDFIIVALAIFLAIKAMNRFKSKLDAAAPPAAPTEVLLTEIRDILKEQGKKS